MTRIALVGDPDWTGAADARRALAALVPEAHVEHIPAGTDPTVDIDGLWLLAPPVTAGASVHDTTIARALDLGLPVVGPVAGTGEGGSPLVRAVPGSRLAGVVGDHPVELPQAAAGGRPAHDYVSAPGTIWVAEAHRGQEVASVTAGGAPFVTLSDYPLATDSGVHPLLLAFAGAVRGRAAARGPWGQQAPIAPMAPAVAAGSSLAPLPDDEPRSYVHQMRTKGYRWWRPFLALFAGCATFVTAALAFSVLWVILDPSLMEAGGADDIDLTSPVTMLMNNLTLAALIPAALVATRLGHWRPMGALWSVAGRIRWRWLTFVSLVTLAVWGSYLVLTWALDGGEVGERPEHWPWLIVITLLTTPLQAAGEEVAFRGWLVQAVGAWIRNPVVAVVIGATISVVLFAAIHGSFDPWVLLDLGAMAAACCYLVWRTGGLEAAIALHTVNNVVLLVMVTLVGGLEGAYVTGETTSTATDAGISAFSTLVMTAILLWLARRSGVAPKKLGAPALSEPATPAP